MDAANWTYLTYACAALGALGLYLALPKQGRSQRAPAMLLGAAAVAGLLLVLRYGLGESAATNVYFYILALLAVGGSVRVITHPRPVYSALYFVMVVLATAALALLAGAEFVAAALVIVYAGAILVTYVFVIMLAQPSLDAQAEGPFHYDANAREPAAAVLAGFLLVATIAGVIVKQSAAANEPRASARAALEVDEGETVSNTEALGRVLMTRYAVSVEVAGVLLLVVMIGALLLARRPVPRDASWLEEEEPPPGELGRRAAPF